MTELGFHPDGISHYRRGGTVCINKLNSYCVMDDMNGTWLAYVIADDWLYHTVPSYTLILALGLLVIAVVLVLMVQKFTHTCIIDSIASTNDTLRAVTSGRLHERVAVQGSLEFSELSSHINSMIQSLLNSTNKMSLVLDRTNMRIGVYEYNTRQKAVRFTEHIPDIFALSSREADQLAEDYPRFQHFLEQLRREPVSGMENTFHFTDRREMYLQLEEIPIPFSFGHVPTRGRTDYDAMLLEADGYMYHAKRMRKRTACADPKSAD